MNGATLLNGGYAVFINDRISPDDALFETLSREASLWACYANESNIISFAAKRVNGEQQWSVFHDCNEGLNHLETSGILPEQFGPLREQQIAKQKSATDIDFVFDVPGKLFEIISGIHYAKDIPGRQENPNKRIPGKYCGGIKRAGWPP